MGGPRSPGSSAPASFGESWAAGYEILGPDGCSVCEVFLPLGETPRETTAALASELRRLQQELGPLIDETIAHLESN